MSHHVRITATYPEEPDYGKLARALLLFLEDQEKAADEGTEDKPPVRAFAPIPREKPEGPSEASA